jgi:membrane associated rhomboid family serine protease
MADRLGHGVLPVQRPGKGRLSLAKVASAFFLMLGFLALLWAIQVANWADGYRLDTSFGILPHHEARLEDIFVAPFLHFSWQHLEGNSVPLLVLGFLAAYRGIGKFLAVTGIVMITSGMAVWLFQPGNELTVGVSGLIFGYFGYVVVRGLFDRNFIDAVVGVLAALVYASILTVAIPGTPGVSWIGHAGGLAGGVLAGWLLRTRRRGVPRRDGGPAVQAASADRQGARSTAGDASGFTPGQGHPRSKLHKELDEMGL